MKEFQKYDVIDGEITPSFHKYSAAEQGTGNLITLRFTAVRAGIAFTTDKSPFHLSVVAQHYIDPEIYADTSPAFDLLFECTDHGLDLESRHNKMADIANLYKCDFYADLSGTNQDSVESYRHWKSKHGFEHGSLLEAPYAGNIRLGVEAIKSYVKSHSLDIPKHSPAFEQLSRITEADLAERDVMPRYYAVEALRHVMSSFKRNPGARRILTPRIPRNTSPLGWMI